MFIITGFPRSMTAWVSNWFTTDRSICLHDPKAHECVATLDELRRSRHGCVGVCGSEAAEDWGPIKSRFPGARWAILRRDAEETMRSFMLAAESKGDALPSWAIKSLWLRRQKQLDEIVANCKPFEIPVGDLKNIHKARAFWKFVLPDIDMDEDRYRMLIGFNITQA